VSAISILQIATYIAYMFITFSYARKALKVAKMPLHLRWELYPIPFGEGHEYGGSYLEELDWWKKSHSTGRIRGAFYLAKKYLFFGGYFKIKRDYWISLYPWHIGFYLLMGFQFLTILCAFILTFTGIEIAAGSNNALGIILYYLSLISLVTSCFLGTLGSFGLLIKRLSNADLRDYTAPSEYFGYLFFLVTFLSALVMWILDPTLANYRDFYRSLVTFQPVNLLPATAVFSIIYVLHMFHLPFTRSTHYITKIFAFFSVLWNDSPNLDNPKLDKKINAAFDQTVSWSAPHIQSGKKWIEVVRELPESLKGKITK
jgi:nitrate reductase gamma subunit